MNHRDPIADPARHMTVTVNDASHDLPVNTTLLDLIGLLGGAPERVATALNGEFVARDRRHARVLRDGDRVTCFQAIVGG